MELIRELENLVNSDLLLGLANNPEIKCLKVAESQFISNKDTIDIAPVQGQLGFSFSPSRWKFKNSVTGISYLPEKDYFLVGLSDEKIYVIHRTAKSFPKDVSAKTVTREDYIVRRFEIVDGIINDICQELKPD